MEILFEIAFQFFGEIILQLLVELLAETGVRALSRSQREPLHPTLAILGYSIWGAIAGGISLLIFPHSPISDPFFRTANLFVTPIIVGFAMMLLGGLRRRRGEEIVRIDRFGYAFTFAFTMALMRFFLAS